LANVKQLSSKTLTNCHSKPTFTHSSFPRVQGLQNEEANDGF
jgi:hypothetical protein